MSAPVQTAVCWYLAVGQLPVVGVAVQVPDEGSYLLPLWRLELPSSPPHTIIRLVVQTAVW